MLSRVDEGVEHPELNVLNVGLFEVVGVEFAHHSSPVLLGCCKSAVCLQVGVEVVRSRFGRIVGEVEHAQGVGGSAVAALLSQREELSHVYLSHIVVGQLCQVALDVAWRERRTSTREEWVYGVPSQSATTESACQPSLVVVVLSEVGRWHAGDNP